mmetsp:Transcript_5197/g.11289  ORF Transcript_5197/g.11289 Transcript_5197/m.11289 type:complete len:278 (+) Transcript_5197:623-1456(+)
MRRGREEVSAVAAAPRASSQQHLWKRLGGGVARQTWQPSAAGNAMGSVARITVRVHVWGGRRRVRPLASLRLAQACSRRRSGQRIERLLERGDQVLLRLDAAGEAHEAVGDADLEPVLCEHVGVRHHSWAGADALEGAEVLAEAPRPLDRVHQRAAGLSATLHLEPEHAAVQVILVLAQRELSLREGVEARVADDVHLGMALQKLGDRLRVLALLLHAQAKRLGSLQRVEGRLRRHDVAVHVLHVLDPVVQLGRGGDDGAADGDVVAVVVLGGRLDH